MSSARAILLFVTPDSPALFEERDADAPQLSVLDQGVTRGDGIFETISVANGNAGALEPHLTRFARSAAMLDLPSPGLEAFRAAIRAGVGRFTEKFGPAAELMVKTVMTRGIEGTNIPTRWVWVEEAPDFTTARTEGIRVITLDRAIRHDTARTAPWLLLGAKTLSYAVNKSALREAGSRGADDVIFISTDGYLLEGPTSNVILKRGKELVTPALDLGILAGTTQASIFERAEQLGFTTKYTLLTLEDLQSADAAWLVSSVRQAAPIRSLNGVSVPVDAELSAEFTRALLSRTE